jgi:branched-chain amino acid transport system substrate-binding protein
VTRFPYFIVFACFLGMLSGAPVMAQKPCDDGASDTEIKIGNIATYKGWGKEYATVVRAEAAYFQKINERGGVNGRKIKFISLDNASEPGPSLELARKLVEDEKVLLIFGSIGTESNLAIRAYMKDKKVPQLFVQTSSAVFDDPARFPWIMGLFATFRSEDRVYAKYLLQNRLTGKIGVLYANDDAGKEYLAGVRDVLADKTATMIVKEVACQVSEQGSDEALNLRIASLKESGADVFLNFSVGPFATRSIGAAYDLGWHPLQFIPNASLSVVGFLEPAGLEKAAGIIANARSKGWQSVRAQSDPAVREFLDWMKKYNPDASLRDQNNVAATNVPRRSSKC